MIESTLNNLKFEIRRIDLLIQQAIERWLLAGQKPTDFQGLFVSDTEVYQLLQRPFGTNWGQTVELEAEQKDAFQQTQEELRQEANKAEEGSRLALLKRIFELDPFEYDTLLICLALSLDLRYERIFGFLQDDVTRKEISINLLLDLLCPSSSERFSKLHDFSNDGRLFRHYLLERRSGEPAAPLLKQTLSIDPAIVVWLLGKYQPQAQLRKHAKLLEAEAMKKKKEKNKRFIDDKDKKLENAIKLENPFLVFSGPDELSQQAAAEFYAAALKRPLLKVNLQGALTDNSPQRVLRLALRDARLTQAIPYFYGCDALLVNGALPSTLLKELCAYPLSVIVAGQANWLPQGIDRERSLFYLTFPLPDYKQRKDLWSYFLPSDVNSKELKLNTLTAQFQLSTEQIRDAVALAQDYALGGQKLAGSLWKAARLYSSPKLSGLADKIEPRFKKSDLVLPEDQTKLLDEIVDTVRNRSVVLEEWGLGETLVSSSGVTVLFAGPPGTGKTMAADVVAGQLGVDLYKIDLSRIVSKYVGETEKNLGGLFDEAANSSAILFFDEADAIFGKRSEVRDAHDRYANIEVSYLLQRMESYNGVSILATNLRANMDEAFTRRLQFAVDFPFPNQTQRKKIWETLLEAIPSDKKEELKLEKMAQLRLSGGSIRNIIVNAAYLAAADGGILRKKDLDRATRREFQKMGRLMSRLKQLDKTQDSYNKLSVSPNSISDEH